MFMPVDDIPKKGMQPGHNKLPLRDGDDRSNREQSRSRSSVSQNSIDAYQNQALDPTSTQITQQTSPQSSPGTGDALQFINLLGTERHDTQGRNTVRSHARRHAWKHQKQQRNKKEVLANNDGNQSKNKLPKSTREKASSISKAPNQGDQFYDQCSKFREVAELLPQRPHSSSSTKRTPPQSHGVLASLPPELAKCAETAIAMISSPSLTSFEVKNGHSDPFDVFPIPLTPRLHHLIHYSRGIRNLVDEDPQETFSFHMGSSPALVFSTLAWTTALSPSKQGVRNAESEYFLQKSIVAINEEISKLNQYGLSDSIIAAVACLTNMENLNGDSRKARIHMNGLRQMVAVRGGMNKLGMNGVLRRLVLWADVFSATRWQSTPQFPLVELPDLLDLAPLCYFRPHATPKPTFAIKNQSLATAASTGSNADLASMMKEIYELAHFLDNVPNKDPSLLDRASFPDRIYIVEHKLLWLLSENEGIQPRDSIMLPLLHGLLLYIYTNIRLTPVDGQIRLTLVSRLQAYLQAADLPALNINFPHELRWVLFLGGGAASSGTPQRAFFVRAMTNCGCRREWGSWENIVLGLKGFETAFLTRCWEFWEEVDRERVSVDLHQHSEGQHWPECLGTEDFFVEKGV